MNLAVHTHLTQRATAADALRPVEQGMLLLVNPNDSKQSAASAAASYHLNTGGSRIRARLAQDACTHLGLSAQDSTSLAIACELLHNASLIHDDLQDRDTTRREQPTVWVAFGEEVAICAGDLMLSAAYCALADMTNTQLLAPILRLVHARVSQAIKGQCVDFQSSAIVEKGASVNPTLSATQAFTLDDYNITAINKSGALLSLPLELALLLAGQKHHMQDARDAAESFAIAYQIQDDLLDFELDAARQTRTPAINILSVLSANITHELPIKTHLMIVQTNAQTLGLQCLNRAQTLAAGLPMGCANLLVSLANEMRAQLTIVRSVTSL